MEENSQFINVTAADQRSTERPVSRFRPRYRQLTPEELELHDQIKGTAMALEDLYARVKPGRYNNLALTHLEQSIMWIVKELTS